ncbi:oligosaccharide flippase family protein [Kroppenstedtia pulmonis]|uniref:Oligosaccharide flippase family protein n=1 Tax=Kroppenstedtia pulmonis TaxID=1380685 RepID=A0A7D4BXN6_9BACL|nr:oligosaccharide flippase family protein [Kroppenstedtia pulmonis]QKG85533.1 oligosaccharide flippase family protein [Kroppenstedtia pulmonis]
MFAKIKQLFSDSTAFALALMGNKIVAFLLVPVYTRYLDPSRFGDWGLTNTIGIVVTYFCVLGTDTAFAFYFFESRDKQERDSYFTAAVFFPVVISLGFVLITSLISAPAAGLLFEDPEGYTHLLTLTILTIVFNVIIQQTLAYARFERQVKTFMIGTMSFVIGSSLASVWFVVFGKMGVMGIVYGQLITQSIVALVLLFGYRKHFTWQVKKKHLRNLLSYGVPLLPALLAFWIMNAVSQPIIYYLVSSEEGGIFGLAVRFASVIALITAAFQHAWRPFSVSIKDREDAKQIYSLLGRGFLVLGTFFIMLLSFLIEPVIKFVAGNPDFYAAYPYVWMLALGTLLNTIHLIVGVGLFVQKKTKTISKTFIIAAVIYLIGNFALVPFIQIWGTVSMTVVTYLYVFLSIYLKGQKVYKINFRIRSMLIYLFLFIFVMAFITWIQLNNWSHLWIYYICAVFLMSSAALLTGLFNAKSLSQLRRFINLRRNEGA